MRVAVCAKPVLDPDAVNAYALWGRLQLDPQGRWLAHQGIPLLMNAYDEQALEAALRLRDRGMQGTITVLIAGGESAAPILRKALAMGADRAVLLRDAADEAGDGLAVAYRLAQAVRKLGGADLVLCGRQASDDDQGVVGPALAEFLGMPSVTIARDIQVGPQDVLRVTRVLPDGEEVVEVALPALVTVSSELGPPRFPTARGMMDARRKQLTIWSPQDLEGNDASPTSLPPYRGPGVQRLAVRVPEIQGQCEFIMGDTVQQKAAALAQRLRQDGLI